MFSLFGAECFEDLAGHLREEALEGLDADNVHRFYHALTLHTPPRERPGLPDELLLEYDQNIVRHTQRLNERRLARGEDSITWKYFQYLALLCTEIYLDRYFRDPAGLLASLNDRVVAHNSGKNGADCISVLDTTADAAPQLNKLAFWMATGSGKTLLMHANILQYRFYLERHGRSRELNRVLLLTPNEGLSRQHLLDFGTDGMEAELFAKDGSGLYAGRSVEILDIHKLKDEMGDKTVAVDAFEGNNLVLVDEGHRGASGGEEGAWMRFRSALCEEGFSFEYSATFAQAIKGNAPLTDLYAKGILFDYSYRYFYGDGFGKDYHIANLEDDSDRERMDTYLTACLLSFFQQLRLHREGEAAFRPFNIEKPLWVFVGGSVTKKLSARDASDIVDILRFLSRYLANRRRSIESIRRVLVEGIVTQGGRNLFAGHYAYLNTAGLSPEDVFDETLEYVFNAPTGGTLHVENLKGADGEVALRVADNDPFGVINVGDDTALVKLCALQGLDTTDREFANSLFHVINDRASTVNVLIGSKKFTEGWNSWRVSTMGLMNVGRGEGAQIIQLFGRGVRLKGYGMALKRSKEASLPPGVHRPQYVEVLETLGVFGVRADYMAQFRSYLEEEGLPAEKCVDFLLPIVRDLGGRKLSTIRLKKNIGGVSTESDDAFRRLGPIPTVVPPDPQSEPSTAYLQDAKVVANWYPKIQAMDSLAAPDADDWRPDEPFLTASQVALLDVERIFFELERFKAERGWHNLNLTRTGIRALLADTTWYRLQIPNLQMALDSMDKVPLWQEIAESLLKRYMERYYTFRRRAWELPHLEYQALSDEDPNFYRVNEDPPEYGYRITVQESQTEVIAQLTELKQAIARGESPSWEFQGLSATWFENHLYQPLLYSENGSLAVTPTPLNRGEHQFVADLKTFVEAERARGSEGFLTETQLYLLRNQSRGRGLGFFEAGNFHPDFILWLFRGTRQHIAFVDPKGIRNLGKDDPKIRFHETVKEIEARLADPSVSLHSLIVSNTPAYAIERLWGLSRREIEARGILFQEDTTYVRKLFERMLSA